MKMSYILKIALTFRFLMYCYDLPLNCKDLKTGEFRYVNPIFSDWKIVRTSNLQIETNEKLRVQVEGSINWISECEYEMIYTKTSNRNFNKMIGKKVTVKILDIKNDTISYYAKLDTIELKSKIIKIK